MHKAQSPAAAQATGKQDELRAGDADKQKHQQQMTEARPPGYNFAAIEAKWRARWKESRLYQVDLQHASQPYYNLMMFPYPSAEGLHVGNVYSYVGSDVHGRFRAMQ